MLDRADYTDFGCHNSIRLEAEHFLNTLALTFISCSGRFVFAVQKHYRFFASDPLVEINPIISISGQLRFNQKEFDCISYSVEVLISCHKKKKKKILLEAQPINFKVHKTAI